MGLTVCNELAGKRAAQIAIYPSVQLPISKKATFTDHDYCLEYTPIKES